MAYSDSSEGRTFKSMTHPIAREEEYAEEESLWWN